MNITDFIKNNIVYLDGGMGTLLQKSGLLPGELPEQWNISHPEVIKNIHKQYFDAGSNIVLSNTFGANLLKFDREKLADIISAAIENAKQARKESTGTQEKFVAFDIGPCGKLLAPFGDYPFEDAVALFSYSVRCAENCGADLIFIETMNDSYETKAALLAAKENSHLPVFVSNAYGKDGKLMTGADACAMVAMLEGMGADAVGLNCSYGPFDLDKAVSEMLQYASVPVIFKPNAGLPKIVDGKTEFDISPEDFACEVARQTDCGVRIIGGCCGTTPEYIRLLCEKTKDKKPEKIVPKNMTCASSYTHAVIFGESPILIGERINPTGKKRFKQALIENDIGYILGEGLRQRERGADILDVNVGLPDIDEEKMLKNAVYELQAVTDAPLQIDTADFSAMEQALRIYNGKPLVNSVNGKTESMEAIFPLVKKYGGTVIALTLDENGIPKDAMGRIAIARKIIKTAERFGINKKDIIFDTLAMTVSADKDAAKETLSALSYIKNTLGCHTSLGVSNVSFGLPVRDAINSAFFTMALYAGLSAAIMNPYSDDMMKAYHSYKAVMGLDENFESYISFCSSVPATASVPEKATASAGTALPTKSAAKGETLFDAIVSGLKENAAVLCGKLISEDKNALDIINGHIIPALDKVGVGFENKTVYLPQLLMSAEAAKSAFEKIKSAANVQSGTKKCVFVLATVKGDIHDIGKNIVRLLLENYGYDVHDLGKDVEPEAILDEVKKCHAPLCGLSALMTTTVPSMEKTVALIREKAPFCRTVVGGAVLTQEYADKIHADKYARDAMETVRYAEQITSGIL